MFMSRRRYFGILSRLAAVVAVVVGALEAFRIYNAGMIAELSRQEMAAAYLCATKITDDRLRQHRNEFGNFALRALDALAGSSGPLNMRLTRFVREKTSGRDRSCRTSIFVSRR